MAVHSNLPVRVGGGGYSVRDEVNPMYKIRNLNNYTCSYNQDREITMKDRTGIIFLLALALTLIAYGCSSSASISAHPQQNKKSSGLK